MRTPLMIATAITLLATPALARDVATAEVFTDSNSHYLDYKTSISEAKRELKKDLARAKDAADRIDAMAEYEAEIADADKDFRKEMAERGVVLPKGTVIVEEDAALLPQ
ncbi:MAG: hypothetical protein ACK4GG_00350 [Sphingomonas sp.]